MLDPIPDQESKKLAVFKKEIRHALMLAGRASEFDSDQQTKKAQELIVGHKDEEVRKIVPILLQEILDDCQHSYSSRQNYDFQHVLKGYELVIRNLLYSNEQEINDKIRKDWIATAVNAEELVAREGEIDSEEFGRLFTTQTLLHDQIVRKEMIISDTPRLIESAKILAPKRLLSILDKISIKNSPSEKDYVQACEQIKSMFINDDLSNLVFDILERESERSKDGNNPYFDCCKVFKYLSLELPAPLFYNKVASGFLRNLKNERENDLKSGQNPQNPSQSILKKNSTIIFIDTTLEYYSNTLEGTSRLEKLLSLIEIKALSPNILPKRSGPLDTKTYSATLEAILEVNKIIYNLENHIIRHGANNEKNQYIYEDLKVMIEKHPELKSFITRRVTSELSLYIHPTHKNFLFTELIEPNKKNLLSQLSSAIKIPINSKEIRGEMRGGSGVEVKKAMEKLGLISIFLQDKEIFSPSEKEKRLEFIADSQRFLEEIKSLWKEAPVSMQGSELKQMIDRAEKAIKGIEKLKVVDELELISNSLKKTLSPSEKEKFIADSKRLLEKAKSLWGQTPISEQERDQTLKKMIDKAEKAIKEIEKLKPTQEEEPRYSPPKFHTSKEGSSHNSTSKETNEANALNVKQTKPSFLRSFLGGGTSSAPKEISKVHTSKEGRSHNSTSKETNEAESLNVKQTKPSFLRSVFGLEKGSKPTSESAAPSSIFSSKSDLNPLTSTPKELSKSTTKLSRAGDKEESKTTKEQEKKSIYTKNPTEPTKRYLDLTSKNPLKSKSRSTSDLSQNSSINSDSSPLLKREEKPSTSLESAQIESIVQKKHGH